MFETIIIIIKILVIILPVLIAVAFFTGAERKIMEAIQRRIGPNVIEFVVPILVLLISIICFFTYTIIIDPYHIVIQTLVFIGILILNLSIFYLYRSDRKLSFMFFLFNCLLIYTYIRLSIDTTFPIALIYYSIIFLGFHIFEETFTKRFLLRTKVILRGYYENSEFVKIILWFFLILIPSLIKHPIIIVSVYQPLMLYCYLFEYMVRFTCFI